MVPGMMGATYGDRGVAAGGRGRRPSRGIRGVMGRGAPRGGPTRGGFRGRGRGAPASVASVGGNWANVFNPEIFKKKVAEEGSDELDEASKETERKIAELKNAGKAKDDGQKPGSSSSTLKDLPESLKKCEALKELCDSNENDKNLSAIMKMVEDEKDVASAVALKRAQEEVDDYRYPNDTFEEFDKRVCCSHHDNVTQWVHEFAKNRGWFVQVACP